jgi:thiosulfate/3-mercaptopyruvate sulfurtransferase
MATDPEPTRGGPFPMSPVTEQDRDAKFEAYADPNVLVSTDWLAERLGRPGLVVVESDEDVLLYETGHVPGAVKIDWHTDLQDPVTRDYLDGEGFAQLLSTKGIARDDTVVFYGDNFNWWAAYALWVFTLFGHPDVRLLDGGRQKWKAEGRELTRERTERPATEYPVVERDDAPIRAFREDVEAHLRVKGPLVDVRSPGEYSGELLSMPDYPQEGAQRGGHIPGAVNVPWKRAANDDGTFKPVEELRAIYAEEQGLGVDDDVIAYCRIGERSSHTWFVLHHLLGLPRVRNYDGSWTEWGNLVRAPIERPGHPVSPPVQ